MNPHTIFVLGDPAAQGSKRIVRTKGGRTIMLEQSKKVKPWREAVAAAAMQSKCPMHEGDVVMQIRVLFARPASHFNKAGEVRHTAPARPGYTDCDKLARAICDALAGIAYHNDRQVAALSVDRAWSPGPSSATIKVAACPPEGGWVYEHPPAP